MLVYVAGPYSATTAAMRAANVCRAIRAGYQLLKAGHFPFVPHLNCLFERELPEGAITYEEYLVWDDQLLRRCDALLCIGRSPGADREAKRAEELGLPVYWSLGEVPAAHQAVRADFPVAIGYRNTGGVLRWGEDMSSVTLLRLRKLEIFTLLGPDGEPHSEVLMDHYGTIRERPLAKAEP